jgi:SnoaL-like domain
MFSNAQLPQHRAVRSRGRTTRCGRLIGTGVGAGPPDGRRFPRESGAGVVGSLVAYEGWAGDLKNALHRCWLVASEVTAGRVLAVAWLENGEQSPSLGPCRAAVMGGTWRVGRGDSAPGAVTLQGDVQTRPIADQRYARSALTETGSISPRFARRFRTMPDDRDWIERFKIQQLIYRYSDSVNRGDLDTMRSVYADDAVWESPLLGFRHESADAFVEFFGRTRRPVNSSFRHRIAQSSSCSARIRLGPRRRSMSSAEARRSKKVPSVRRGRRPTSRTSGSTTTTSRASTGSGSSHTASSYRSTWNRAP